MQAAFRSLVVTTFISALALRLIGCASARTPAPTATPAKPAVTATTAGGQPAAPSPATTPSPTSAEATSKTVCLECHPYDDVIAASANYVAPSGETHTPHRYLNPSDAAHPHDATGVDSTPECRNCHTAHELPPAEPIDLSKVKVEWCYAACHHQYDFTPCSKCHDE